jgi:hypothetical protein
MMEEAIAPASFQPPRANPADIEPAIAAIALFSSSPPKRLPSTSSNHHGFTD